MAYLDSPGTFLALMASNASLHEKINHEQKALLGRSTAKEFCVIKNKIAGTNIYIRYQYQIILRFKGVKCSKRGCNYFSEAILVVWMNSTTL